MDWDDSYHTMSDQNNYTIWHFLKKCHEKGWIYQGTDVMPWCPRCGTGLSEHEIVTEGYKEIVHPGLFIKLPIIGRDEEYLLIWTTTPWTLTSNIAAAVHPEKKYSKQTMLTAQKQCKLTEWINLFQISATAAQCATVLACVREYSKKHPEEGA